MDVNFVEPVIGDYDDDIDIFDFKKHDDALEDEKNGDIEDKQCEHFTPDCLIDLIPNSNDDIDTTTGHWECEHDAESAKILFKCKCNGLYCKLCLMKIFNYAKSTISKLLKKQSVFVCSKCVIENLAKKKKKKKTKK